MNKSKILQDLVHSIVAEQTERKSSDAGIYDRSLLTEWMFDISDFSI